MTKRGGFQGIVFDMDGTLIDSLALTFDAFQYAIESQGGPAMTPAQIAKHFGMGENKMMEKILGPEKAEAAYLSLIEYTEKNIERVPFHKGAREVIAELRLRGIPMSIFTGRSWMTTEKILKYHGILADFVTVVADDHVSQPKPSPEGLLLALSRMKLQPHEALFVGDSTFDLQAASAANVAGVAALWDPLVKPDRLKALNPFYAAQSPAELLQFFTNLV